ncbi:MAG: hypothetical protein U0176_23775 [Bacteroidia bacterium]
MMAQKWAMILLIVLISINMAMAQRPIPVADRDITLEPGESRLEYFAFDEGDEILIRGKQLDGKLPVQVSIAPFGAEDIFSKSDFKKLAATRISVSKRQVYRFTFLNQDKEQRCRLHLEIHRVSASNNPEQFITDVTWREEIDTNGTHLQRGVEIRKDTLVYQVQRKRIHKTDTAEVGIIDKTLTVHSSTNGSGPETKLKVELPRDQSEPMSQKKLISWAYWVAVDDPENSAWNKNVQIMKTLVKGAAKVYMSPLGALAMGAVTDLLIPEGDDDIGLELLNWEQYQARASGNYYNFLDKGADLKGAYKGFPPTKDREIGLILHSDNMLAPVDVHVKFVAMVETKHFKMEIQTIRKPGVRIRIPVISAPTNNLKTD